MIIDMVRMCNGSYAPIDSISAHDYAELGRDEQAQVRDHLKAKIEAVRLERLELAALLTGARVR